MPTRYYITLPDPARGGDADLAFKSQGAEGLAAEFQDALRSDRLFQRWRLKQEDPDEVDAAFGANDPNATVQGKQQDLHRLGGDYLAVIVDPAPASGPARRQWLAVARRQRRLSRMQQHE
jgi:hypothetical protein